MKQIILIAVLIFGVAIHGSDAQEKIRVGQGSISLQSGLMQGMRARKIDVAGSAAFDYACAHQFGEFNELVYDGGIAPGLLGDDQRILCARK